MAGPRIFRAEEANFLSNAYLIADPDSGKGVLVDSNGATDPLAEVAEREGIEVTHLLLTHHHYDHVVGCEELAKRFGVGIWGHELTKQEVDAVTDIYGDGDMITSGGLEIKPIFTPGHCADHLALLVGDTDLLTADVLFKGTVGGTASPTATGLDDPRIDHVEADGARPRDPDPPRATASPRRSAPSGSRTRSSASGAGSRSPATSRSRSVPPTRPSASRRRCCSGRRTTTAATRR